jgi:hypothetical protein
MQHKFLRLFVDDVWTGPADRTIWVDGVEYDMDQYAKDHGIELPDAKKSKKQINKVEEHNADMDRTGDTSDTEES